MSYRWISSLQNPNSKIVTPTSVYFPFGSERQKMKAYIFDQLHGKQTLQNEEILKKFRKQALIRRHNYLHRFSQRQKYKTVEPLNQEQNLPTLSKRKNPQSSFMSREYRYNSLVPTEKSQPPIFKYSSLQKQMYKQKNIKSNQTIKKRKTKQLMLIDPSASKKRSHSVQIRTPFKERALAKIKEIAKHKRQKKYGQDTNNSTDSSQIMQQLQHKVQQSKLEYDYNSKQLKRFKQYRKYLKSVHA